MIKVKFQDRLFDDTLTENETLYEEKLPDGTVVRHKRVRQFSGKGGKECDPTNVECLEYLEKEGPVREAVEVEEDEEILADGTVHTVNRVRRHSLKHISRSVKSISGEDEEIFSGEVEVPGKSREEIIEVFEEPAKPVSEVEEVEITNEDGSKVKRKMRMNRMVHHIKTSHQSFDDEGNKEVEEFEVDEIVPGTETAFYDDGSSSSSSSNGEEYDDEYYDEDDDDAGPTVRRFDTEVTRTQETSEDGTVVTKKIVKTTEMSNIPSSQLKDAEWKELDETGLVKRVVKKVTYDPGQPQVIEMPLNENTSPSDIALLQTSGNSVDNTYSTISSDFNEAVIPTDNDASTELTPLTTQIEKLVQDEGKRVVSSYENVYDGVPLDPQINRLSLDASELDIGDRFDTKQKEMHLQLDNRTSSYERVYDTQIEPQRLDILHEDMEACEDKSSSSSSECAQLDDMMSDQDDDVCVTPDEKSEGTDVEEQFSPIATKRSPKPIFNLTQDNLSSKSTFAFSETPPDSLSPLEGDDDRISPIQQTLEIPDAGAMSVGVSPSELPKDHIATKAQYEIQEECLMCSYDKEISTCVDEESEAAVDADDIKYGIEELKHEYPVYDNLAFIEGVDDAEGTSEVLLKSTECPVREYATDVQCFKKEDTPSKTKYTDFVTAIGELENESVDTHHVSTVSQSDDDDIDIESSSSSEDGGNEVPVLDEKTGTYIKLPWEIAYQYKRQTSETYIYKGEEKGALRQQKTIDMGLFYRRDNGDDQEKDEIKNNQTSNISGPTVTFALSMVGGDHMPFETLHSESKTIEDTKDMSSIIYEDEKNFKENDVEEPHNQIDETHNQIVIDSIMESRKVNKEELEMKEEHEVQFQDSFTSTRDDEIEESERQFEMDISEKRLSGSSFQSSGTMTSSYVTALNSLESSTSTLESAHYSDAMSGEELFEREDVTTETSLTPVREHPVIPESESLGVVSRESRQCQYDLLEETSDQKDRSLSPSRDCSTLIPSSLIGTFPMALPSIGKAIADNAIYESSETGGDTTEEKLSPIEETAHDDFPEEEQEESKQQHTEKHVTFQTNVQHLHSVSSEDLVKTSTSSSEMEPTLLAASYDLDSGRVSHVVTCFDMSPDTVEKQFVAPTTSKAILSSPDDDVFEAVGTPTNGADSKNHLKVLDASGTKERKLEKSSSSDSYVPSPPAPTPKEISAIHDTMPDLQRAANKLKYAAETEEECKVEEVKAISLHTVDDIPKPSTDRKIESTSEQVMPFVEEIHQDHFEIEKDDDSASPFEIMSPSDLCGYDQYIEEMAKIQMMTSFESVTTASSSFTEVSTPEQKVDLSISFSSMTTATMIPDTTLKSESSFEHSSPISSEPSEKGLYSPLEMQAPSEHSEEVNLPDILQESVSSTDEQLKEKCTGIRLPNGPTEVEYSPDIDLDYSHSSVHQPDLILVSTLYDHEDVDDKVSSEIVVPEQIQADIYESQTIHTHSIIEELQPPLVPDQLITSDQTLYGLEMPSEETGVTSISVSQIEMIRPDTETESDSVNITGGLISQIEDEVTDHSDSKDIEQVMESGCQSQENETELNISEIDREPMISTECERNQIEDSLENKIDGIYHGKRALELDNLEIKERLTDSDQYNSDTTGDSIEREKYTDTYDQEHMQSFLMGQPDTEEIKMDDDLLDIEGSQQIQVRDKTFPSIDISVDGQENEQTNNILETCQEVKVKVIQGDSELVNIESDQSSFELSVDSYDLERPITPTPVDRKQHFFQDDSNITDNENEDEEVEIQASEFVESVLSEACSRVHREVFQHKDAIEEQLKTDVKPMVTEENKSVPEMNKCLQKDEQSPTTTSSEIAQKSQLHSVLVKQISEDIPGITLTTHFHREHDSDEDFSQFYKEKDDIQDQRKSSEMEEPDLVYYKYTTGDTSNCASSFTSLYSSKESFVEKETFNTNVGDLPISDSEIQATLTFTSECIPEEPEENQGDDYFSRKTYNIEEVDKQTTDTYDYGKACIPEVEEDSESDDKPPLLGTSSARPLTMVFPANGTDKIDGDSINKGHLEFKEIAGDGKYEIESDDSLEEHYDDETGDVHRSSSPLTEKKSMIQDHFLAKTSDSAALLESSSQKTEEVIKIDKESKSEDQRKSEKEKVSYDITETFQFHSELSLGKPEVLHDDFGDTSSVESFTTVVPADQEDEDDDYADNRLDDLASMTSSCHSDVMGPHLEDDLIEKEPSGPLIDWNQKEIKEFEEKTRKESEQERLVKARNQQIEEEALQKKFEELRLIKSEKDHSLIEWEEGSESSMESDRYEYVDKNALSIITEISDEDKFELMDTDDLKSDVNSETMSERPYGSPEDFPPPSPGINFFRGGKSADKDDISVTSSLLEFERLEHEIDQSGSRGSIEHTDKDSLGGSLDERHFVFNKSTDRDDISITSSLAEFERLEREVAQSSSASSVEKITPDSGSRSSDIEGSKSSLGDIDKLERDSPGSGPERKISIEGMNKRSETSSLASLNEFERLEQEILLADELEAEAQKIVSILESGSLVNEEFIKTSSSSSLMAYQMKKDPVDDDMDKDSIEDKDEPEDSLTEGKASSKKENVDQADADSLDGDMSEINSMTSSVILNQKVGKEEDSLREEESMKISSDSLGDDLGIKLPRDKDKFDTDSLQEQEGIMERSVDSLEGEKKSSKEDDKMDTDSLCGQDDIMQRSGEDMMQRSVEDVMQTSADSLDNYTSVTTHEMTMDSSIYSVDSSIFSRSSAETMRSAGSHHSDSSTEIMRVSAESFDAKRRKEKQWLIDNYHSYRQSGHGFIDQEGNITTNLKSFKIEDNYGCDWDEDLDDESPDKKAFTWGPYEEKKKVFTMAEWEAMKEEKRRASIAKATDDEEGRNTHDERDQEVVPVKNESITVKSTMSTSKNIQSSSVSFKSSTTHVETKTQSHYVLEQSDSSDKKQEPSSLPVRCQEIDDSSPTVKPKRFASIDDDDFAEYDVTEHHELMHGIPEHFAQKSGPIYIDPDHGMDSEEDEILHYPIRNLAEEDLDPDDDEAQGDEQSHRLLMKKEIHTKTILKDGQEQTFVHEESRVEQDADPPEELRDSMQQIIDQFMETPVAPAEKKMLEHDV